MHKRYFRIVLTVVLFVGLVAVGVHALNREARANTTLHVFVHEDWVPVNELTLRITLYDENEDVLEGPVQMGGQGGGIYVYTTNMGQTEFYKWGVTIDDDVILVDPPVEPATATSTTTLINWEVDV